MPRHEPKTRRQRQETVSSDFINDALSGPGQALPETTRASLEPRFRHDFSKVRIYDDAQAHDAATDLGAKAFTVGENIAFNAGRFEPHSPEGERLLMHELSHTVQQGPVQHLPDQLEVSNQNDPAEQAARAVTTNTFNPNLTPGSSAASVQLEPEEEEMQPHASMSSSYGMPEEEELPA